VPSHGSFTDDSGVTELRLIVMVLEGFVLVMVRVLTVVDVDRIVDVGVVTFGVIDEYTISVEIDKGPATTVMLLFGPRRSTTG
jgi:hypothetical protein